MLDPKALEEAFRQWVAAVATLTKGEVVAIDGKTLRRSFNKADSTARCTWSARGPRAPVCSAK